PVVVAHLDPGVLDADLDRLGTDEFLVEEATDAGHRRVRRLTEGRRPRERGQRPQPRHDPSCPSHGSPPLCWCRSHVRALAVGVFRDRALARPASTQHWQPSPWKSGENPGITRGYGGGPSGGWRHLLWLWLPRRGLDGERDRGM